MFQPHLPVRLPCYDLAPITGFIECTETIIPDGDFEEQMRDIKLYFKKYTGKVPKNFTIGDVK